MLHLHKYRWPLTVSYSPEHGDGKHHRSCILDTSIQHCGMMSSLVLLAEINSSTTLYRLPYIMFVVLIYASLAAASWAIICVMVYKPISTKTYSFNNEIGFFLPNSYTKNEEVFRAMRVVQALVGLLTIPITSSACAFCRCCICSAQYVLARHVDASDYGAYGGPGMDGPDDFLLDIYVLSRVRDNCKPIFVARHGTASYRRRYPALAASLVLDQEDQDARRRFGYPVKYP